MAAVVGWLLGLLPSSRQTTCWRGLDPWCDRQRRQRQWKPFDQTSRDRRRSVVGWQGRMTVEQRGLEVDQIGLAGGWRWRRPEKRIGCRRCCCSNDGASFAWFVLRSGVMMMFVKRCEWFGLKPATMVRPGLRGCNLQKLTVFSSHYIKKAIKSSLSCIGLYFHSYQVLQLMSL